MTRYFRFEGYFLADDVVLTDDAALELTQHVMHALNTYEDDGFRFVDADASGTLADGCITFSWSDFGLGRNSTSRTRASETPDKDI